MRATFLLLTLSPLFGFEIPTQIKGPLAALNQDSCDTENATYLYKISPKNLAKQPVTIKWDSTKITQEYRDGFKLKKCFKINKILGENATKINGNFDESKNGNLVGQFKLTFKNGTEIQGELDQDGLKFIGSFKIFHQGKLKKWKVFIIYLLF